MHARFFCVLLLASTLLFAADEAPPEGHPLAWYGWATVTTAPSMEALRNLNDGDLETAGLWGPGPESGGELVFVFPRPIEVTTFRFVQSWLTASAYVLTADTDGDGSFDATLATRRDAEPIQQQWIALPVNRQVHALRFVAIAGNASYRRPFPVLREVEIRTREPIATPAAPVVRAGRALQMGAELPWPAITRRTTEISVSADAWMAGLVLDGRNLPEDGDITGMKGFQTFIERLRQIDANAVRIFLETYCGANKMPWPSAVCDDFGKDIFGAYVRGLHANQLKAYIFLHAWISPLQQADKMASMPWRRWDYPYENSERLMKEFPEHYTVRYPCVVNEDDFRTKWTAILAEAVDQGVDGVFVMPDEYYYKGHRLNLADCPHCTRGFQERYGFASMPKDAGDTEAYRKWKLYEYEAIAEVFRQVGAELRRKKPELTLVSCANQGAVQATNHRLEHGVCNDILGRDTNPDLAQVYGDPNLDYGGKTALMKRFEAAFGAGRLLGSIQWLNIKGHKPDRPILLHGRIAAFAMNGARSIENYRLSYMHDTGWWDNAVSGYRMLRLLDEWGVPEGKTPARVCLLISRASEDWWQVRTEALMGGTIDAKAFNLMYAEVELGTERRTSDDERRRFLDADRFRGPYANRCLEGLLTEYGIPYDTRYADREDTLGNLANYALIVLPFGYSLSDEAFASLKSAVEGGAKLLIVNQLAPTDAYGNPRQEPLLKALLDHPNVTFVATNLAAAGMDPAVRRDLRRQLVELSGPEACSFEPNGAKVEFLARQTAPNSFVLSLGNWEKEREATCAVGVPLPPGNYRLTLADSQRDTLNEGAIDGQSVVTAEALRRFDVTLPAGAVRLIRIIPAP